MALFDKINKEDLLAKAKEVGEKTGDFAKKTGDSAKKSLKSKASKKQHDPSETTYNQRAQSEYQKKFEEFTSQYGAPTIEQEAILYAQAYQMQITKNPASAKFPTLEEFNVTVNEDTYTVTGYLDATNSYGAQVRGNMKLNLTKKDGKWVCTDKHTSLQKIYLYFLLGSILISLIAYFYYMAQLSKF